MRGLCILFITLLIHSTASARDDAPADFNAYMFSDPDQKIAWPMAYRLYAPPTQPGEKLPLVVHLHGAGERGIDHSHFDAAGRLFTSLSTQREFPAFVVAPQCPGVVELITIDGHETMGVRASKTYDRHSGDWQQFDLPIGRYIRGKQTHFVIEASKDKKTSAIAFDVGDAIVHEGDREKGLRIDLSCVPELFLDEAQLFKISDNGDGSYRFMGEQDRYGMRVPAEYEVTPATISFRARIDTTSRFIAVGLDNNGVADAMRWVDTDWESESSHALAVEPTEPMQMVLKLIDKLVAEHAIDPNRIYLSGLSMGGFGVYDAAMRQPERFAAVLGLCGGAANDQADRVSKLPIWVFHGTKDAVVPVERSRSWVGALKAVSAPVRYTEYPETGHNCWDKVYSDREVLVWLFGQRREKP